MCENFRSCSCFLIELILNKNQFLAPDSMKTLFRNTCFVTENGSKNTANYGIYLYILHMWVHCSDTLMLYLHKPHTVPRLCSFRSGLRVWIFYTQSGQQGKNRPAHYQIRPPMVLSSSQTRWMESTTPPHCTVDSSADWSSMMVMTWRAPPRCTACWDSWWRAWPPGPVAKDCSALPEYLRRRWQEWAELVSLHVSWRCKAQVHLTVSPACVLIGLMPTRRLVKLQHTEVLLPCRHHQSH